MHIKRAILLLLIPLFLSACILPDFFLDLLGGSTEHSSTETPASPYLTPDSTVTSTHTQAKQPLQIVERTYTDHSDDPRYEIQLLWPNLMGEGWQTDSFNRMIDTLILNDADDFLSVIDENNLESDDQVGEQPLSTFTVDYELAALESGIVSVQLIITQYIALSVHPFTISHAINYDAQSGELLTLRDLFDPEADYLSPILSAVDDELESRDLGYQAGIAEDVMGERENWNLTPEGLRLNFDAYEVGPYAAGPQAVIIPWEDLAEVLNPQGPAGLFYP